MKPVSLSQMRAAVQTAMQRAQSNPPKMRLSESDLLRSHLQAVEQYLAVHEAVPGIIEATREAAVERRKVPS